MPAASRESANAQQRKWYQSHRPYQLAAVARRKRQVASWFRKFKRSLVCPCGEADPRSLDFHHRDPKTKRALVSVLAHAGSMKQLLEEIAKCDVRCCNCHRKLTHKL